MVILKDFRFWLCTVGIVILGFISGYLVAILEVTIIH